MSLARLITVTMGGTWHGHYGMIKCPCHPDNNPSLQINDDHTKSHGLAVHCHAGCPWEDIKDELCRRGLLNGEAKQPRKAPQQQRHDDSEAHRVEYALTLWAETVSLPDTRGWRYFTEQRGLDLTRLGNFDHVLRWHRQIGAVVALMTDPVINKPTGIHRTILNPDGTKRERKMLGKAGVIRLSPDEDVLEGLGLTEGIEDGLAALLWGFAPVWAAASAWGISSFPVLSGIESLTIFADIGQFMSLLILSTRSLALTRLHSSHVRMPTLITNVSNAMAMRVDLPALPNSFCKK
jgi:hypothetical protein